VKAPGARRHPDFVQGFLQVDDDLAAVRERQRHHASHSLIVDVGVGLLVDAVAAALDALEQRLGPVHVFEVGHYNHSMLSASQILVSAPARRLILAAIVGTALPGCGQKGPLYLPTGPSADSRATLPETLKPANAPAGPASAPPTGTASPVRQP
jgi:predicted small lipoprotein YifL